MSEQNSFGIIKIASVAIVIVGITTLIASTLFLSSYFTILGISLVFWGTILLYVIPTTSNLALLLNAAIKPSVMTIEKILSQNKLEQKGIYLSTNCIKKNSDELDKKCPTQKQSSVIFIIPKNVVTSIDHNSSIQSIIKDGVTIIPLGTGLCELFERQLGKSFSEIDIHQFARDITNVLTKGLRLARSVGVYIEGTAVTVEVTSILFTQNCHEMGAQSQTHKQVGCLLASSLACALAKVTCEPVIIANETLNLEAKQISIRYEYRPNVRT